MTSISTSHLVAFGNFPEVPLKKKEPAGASHHEPPARLLSIIKRSTKGTLLS
jgi:hypothetical protein